MYLVGADEGHGQLSKLLGVEAAHGEGGGAETGGSFGREAAVDALVYNLDREWAGAQVAFSVGLACWPLAVEDLASDLAPGYSMRGPRKPITASRMASPEAWISCIVS